MAKDKISELEMGFGESMWKHHAAAKLLAEECQFLMIHATAYKTYVEAGSDQAERALNELLDRIENIRRIMTGPE